MLDGQDSRLTSKDVVEAATNTGMLIAPLPQNEAEKVEILASMYATPGYCSEITYLYFAENLSFVGQKLDHGEFVELKKIPLSDLVKMVMNNEIPDAKTAIAILKADKIVNG